MLYAGKEALKRLLPMRGYEKGLRRLAFKETAELNIEPYKLNIDCSSEHLKCLKICKITRLSSSAQD